MPRDLWKRDGLLYVPAVDAPPEQPAQFTITPEQQKQIQDQLARQNETRQVRRQNERRESKAKPLTIRDVIGRSAGYQPPQGTHKR